MKNRILRDTRARTFLKALSWRAVAFVITVVVAWIVTRRIGVAASVGFADTLVKVGAYYIHERLWLRVPFGQPDYEI